LQLDLTVMDTPAASSSGSARPVPLREAEPAASRGGVEAPSTSAMELDVAALVEMARTEIREAARTAMAEAAAEFSAQMEQWRVAAEEFLAETRQEVASMVRLLEEARDNSAEVGERTARKYEEAHRTTLERFDQLNQRAKEGMDRVLTHSDERLKRLSSTAEDLVREARTLGRKLGWKVWSIAAAVSLGIIILLTLLRPGWTMSSEQRRALRVGEAVIYTYSAATPAERAEMRRVNRWREPAQPDSTEAPPLPPRR
jgi:hypothetical protein